MPTDIHPEHGICGIELILTRLHAGGKFSNKNYQFSGGLHGVGVSVVNALSSRLEVSVRRDGIVSFMSFKDGYKDTDLQQTGTCGRRNTGTTFTSGLTLATLTPPLFRTPINAHSACKSGTLPRFAC